MFSNPVVALNRAVIEGLDGAGLLSPQLRPVSLPEAALPQLSSLKASRQQGCHPSDQGQDSLRTRADNPAPAGLVAAIDQSGRLAEARPDNRVYAAGRGAGHKIAHRNHRVLGPQRVWSVADLQIQHIWRQHRIQHGQHPRGKDSPVAIDQDIEIQHPPARVLAQTRAVEYDCGNGRAVTTADLGGNGSGRRKRRLAEFLIDDVV